MEFRHTAKKCFKHWLHEQSLSATLCTQEDISADSVWWGHGRAQVWERLLFILLVNDCGSPCGGGSGSSAPEASVLVHTGAGHGIQVGEAVTPPASHLLGLRVRCCWFPVHRELSHLTKPCSFPPGSFCHLLLSWTRQP